MSKNKLSSTEQLAEHLAAHILVNAPLGLDLEGLSRSIASSPILGRLARNSVALQKCLDQAISNGFLETHDASDGVLFAPTENLLDGSESENSDSDNDLEDNSYSPDHERSYSTVGRITITQNGYGFVSRRVGNDILIPSSSIGEAISGDLVRIDVFDDGCFEATGEVTSVLEQADMEFIGILSPPIKPSNMHRLLPYTSRLCGRGVLVNSSQYSDLSGSLVRVKILKRPERPGRSIVGKIIDICPNPEDPQNIAKAISVEFGLPTNQSELAAESARQISDIQQSLHSPVDRTDLKQLPFITIDGESSKDFDDAIFLKKVSETDWNLKVAIADVSYYVLPDSPLDEHAYERGTSVYFADQCIPMLPETLSNGICSLVEGEERFTLVADMIITASGEIKNYEFYRASIVSQKRLTYQQADRILCGTELSPLSSMIEEMNLCRQALNARRIGEGALVFSLDEIDHVEADEDPNIFRKTTASARLKSQLLIEEFMLAANTSAALFLSCRSGGRPILLRTHEKPDAADINELAVFAGISPKEKSSRQILLEITHKAKSYAGEIFMNKALRCMKKAIYSAVEGKNGRLHFSLATKYYTHFTSPIRRYPDLVVHRAITNLIEDEEYSNIQDMSWLIGVAEHCSKREKIANLAERASQKRIAINAVEQLVGTEVIGTVSGLSKKGLFIEIGDPKVEGLVPSKIFRGRFDRSTCSYYLYSDDRNMQKKQAQVIKLGAQLRVKIIEVCGCQRTITLEIA